MCGISAYNGDRLARVKAFDRHSNMYVFVPCCASGIRLLTIRSIGSSRTSYVLLPNFWLNQTANNTQKEMWTEPQKAGKGRPVNKDRFISKMYFSLLYPIASPY
jgi:hypothetical protein